jgi:hypothetical protein
MKIPSENNLNPEVELVFGFVSLDVRGFVEEEGWVDKLDVTCDFKGTTIVFPVTDIPVGLVTTIFRKY